MVMSAGDHVASLARPSGNITGLSEQYSDLLPQWLELLKDAVPRASRVGVLIMTPFGPAGGDLGKSFSRQPRSCG